MDVSHLDREVPRYIVNWRFCPHCSTSLVFEQGEAGALPNASCPSCGFKHFVNPSPTANCLIFNDEGKVLLVTRAHDPKKGSLCMPGGFLDAGEGALEAAKRELMEEACITAHDWRCVNALPDWYSRERGESTCNICFIAVADAGQIPQPGSDATAAGWYSPEVVGSVLEFDNQQQMWSDWLAEKATREQAEVDDARHRAEYVREMQMGDDG